jgi:hypothetical protein
MERRGLGVAVVSAWLIAAPVAAQEQAPAGAVSADEAGAKEADIKRARELHREGRALYKKKQYAEARAALLAAWDLKQHYSLAGALADCEMKLLLYRDAAEHFAFYLREVGREKPPPESARKLYEQARAQVGTLDVTVSAPDAIVMVDGVIAGLSPLEDPVFVKPGRRVLEARRGHEIAVATVEAAAGTRFTMQLDLKPEFAPAAPVAAASEDLSAGAPSQVPGPGDTPNGGADVPEVPGEATHPYPYLVAGGVLATAAALGAGVTFTVLAVNDGTAADTELAQQKQDGVRCSSPPQVGTCDALLSLRKQQETFANVALTTFIAGGVLGAATAAYVFWPRSEAQPATALRVAPVVMPGGGGLWIGGAF